MNIWLDYLRRPMSESQKAPPLPTESNLCEWMLAVQPCRVVGLVKAMIASLNGAGYSAQAEELRELVNEFSAAMARVEEVRKQMMPGRDDTP